MTATVLLGIFKLDEEGGERVVALFMLALVIFIFVLLALNMLGQFRRTAPRRLHRRATRRIRRLTFW